MAIDTKLFLWFNKNFLKIVAQVCMKDSQALAIDQDTITHI